MIKYHQLTPNKLKPLENISTSSEKYQRIDICIFEFFTFILFIISMVNFKEELLNALKDK